MTENEKDKLIEELQSIIAKVPGNVYWKSIDNKFRGCNDNNARAIGLHSRDDIVGKTNAEILPPHLVEKLEEIDAAVMRDDKQYTVEEEGIDATGKRAVYYTNKKPLHDKRGKVMGLLGISIDITELKEAQEALRKEKEKAEKAQKIAEEANHAKTIFIRNMQHDIRTPFCGIWGLADLLKADETDPEKLSVLNDIAACSKELLDYCNVILDFSKVEEGKTLAEVKTFNLQGFVDSLVAMEVPAARNKGVALKAKISAHCPAQVRVDHYRLQRVMINLVSNAIKFTEEGYVNVNVNLTDKETDAGVKPWLQFIIEDSGVGIPADKQDLVFERFAQLNETRSSVNKGQGLGLSVVKEFVHEMGGDIHLQSVHGEGSTFTVEVPLQEEVV